MKIPSVEDDTLLWLWYLQHLYLMWLCGYWLLIVTIYKLHIPKKLLNSLAVAGSQADKLQELKLYSESIVAQLLNQSRKNLIESQKMSLRIDHYLNFSLNIYLSVLWSNNNHIIQNKGLKLLIFSTSVLTYTHIELKAIYRQIIYTGIQKQPVPQYSAEDEDTSSVFIRTLACLSAMWLLEISVISSYWNSCLYFHNFASWGETAV